MFSFFNVQEGDTSLHIAVRNGDMDTTLYLLEVGAHTQLCNEVEPRELLSQQYNHSFTNIRRSIHH